MYTVFKRAGQHGRFHKSTVVFFNGLILSFWERISRRSNHIMWSYHTSQFVWNTTYSLPLLLCCSAAWNINENEMVIRFVKYLTQPIVWTCAIQHAYSMYHCNHFTVGECGKVKGCNQTLHSSTGTLTMATCLTHSKLKTNSLIADFV